MSSVRLRLLGGFRVEVDGSAANDVLSHSPKGLLLMQYLILNRGRMERTAALIEALWPEPETGRPQSAMKTLISRLRVLMQQVSPNLAQCLKTVPGGYQWESQPGVTVDVEEFLALAEELRGQVELTDEKQRSFRRLMELYAGRALCDQEQPTWMRQRVEALHQVYLTAVEEHLRQLEQQDRMREMAGVCREALDTDPLNEQLNMRLMDALMATGRESEAIKQYQHAAGLQAASARSVSALDDYYARMLQRGRDLDRSLSNLREELLQGNDKPGALLCDRAVFHELFRLEQRSLERTGATMILGVAMLTGLENSPWQLDSAMTGLTEVMVNRLRRGDIVTRLNATQMAMLLPHAEEKDASAITDRLKRSFYLQFPSSGCTLNFSFVSMPIGITANPSGRRRAE
ncbi:MAG: winged helix-turn-helix domain-containing protein [Clostridia bacterium]|nr:winged helix-turn-helix domain-containing protein [Clostridia bacterium]